MLQKLSHHDFESFYRLLSVSFPPEERRTKAGQRALLDSEPAYCIYGIKNEANDRVDALMAVWELTDALFLEHFAVDPLLRGQGLGSHMLAELANGTQLPLCLEVEPPSTEIAKRRIEFYKRNGFFLNEFPYIQPSLAHGEPPIPLMLMTYGKAVNAEEFHRIYASLYRRVYRVDPLPTDEFNRLTDMHCSAKRLFSANSKCERAQALVLQTTGGVEYGAVIDQVNPNAKSGETALLQSLLTHADTVVSHILCVWETGVVDLPSMAFRQNLCKLNPKNRSARIFVVTDKGVAVKEIMKNE